MTPMDPLDAFQMLDLRVGRVRTAEPLAGAKKPAYKLTVDFGPLGVRGSSAQLTDLYSPEQLIGRLVIAPVNLGVRRIAGFASGRWCWACRTRTAVSYSWPWSVMFRPADGSSKRLAAASAPRNRLR